METYLLNQVQMLFVGVPPDRILTNVTFSHQQSEPRTHIPLHQNPQQLLDHPPPRPPTPQRALAQSNIHVNVPHALKRRRRDKFRQPHEEVGLERVFRCPTDAPDELMAVDVAFGVAACQDPGLIQKARRRQAVDD